MWSWDGYIVSDAGALDNIISFHQYINNTVDTAAQCIKAGCNLELGSTVYKQTVTPIHKVCGVLSIVLQIQFW